MVSLQRPSVISSLHSVESSTASPNSISSSKNSFQVDDAVYVLGYSPRLTGVVQYVGETLEMGNDCWLGLILTGNSQGKGDSDGLWKGVRYFTSAPNNGIFVKEGQVEKRRLTKLESLRLRRELPLPKIREGTTDELNQSKEGKDSGSTTLAIVSPKNQNTKVNKNCGCTNLTIEQNLKSGGQRQKMEHEDPTRETTKQKSEEGIHEATDITREDNENENPSDEEAISIDSKKGIENEVRDSPEIIGEGQSVCNDVKENEGLRKDKEEVKRKLALTQLEQRLKDLRSLKKSIKAECEEEEREDQESKPRDRANADRANQLEQRLNDLSSLKNSIRAACQDEKREDQDSKPHDRSNVDCSNLGQGNNSNNRKMNKLEELRLLRKHSVMDCRQTRVGDSMVTPLRSNKSCDSKSTNLKSANSKIATATAISSSNEDRTADKFTIRERSELFQQDPIFTPSAVKKETKNSRVQRLSDYFEKHSKNNVGNKNASDSSGCQNELENSTETKETGNNAPLESTRSVQSSGSGSRETPEYKDGTKQSNDPNQITTVKQFCDSVKNKRDLELKRLRDLRKRLAVLRELNPIKVSTVASSLTTASSSPIPDASSILVGKVGKSKNVPQQERLEKLFVELEAKKKENEKLRKLMETSRRKVHHLTVQNKTLEGKLGVSEKEATFYKSILSLENTKTDNDDEREILYLEKTDNDDLLLIAENNSEKTFSKEQQNIGACRSADM